MKSLFTLIFLITIMPGTILTQNFSSLDIYNSHQFYKVSSVTDKRIKHENLKKIIKEIVSNSKIKLDVLGKSLEGREIFHLSLGSGKTKVLLWSQMHGDESTATMALFDHAPGIQIDCLRQKSNRGRAKSCSQIVKS